MNAPNRNRLIVLLICAIAVLAGTSAWLHWKRQTPARPQITPAPGQHSEITHPSVNAVVQDTNVADGMGTRSGNESADSNQSDDCIVLLNGKHATDIGWGAAMDGHDLEDGMDCSFHVNASTAAFTLHFAGRPDNTLGDIEVRQAGKVIQTITGHEVNLNGLAPAGLDLEVSAIDANFDGYQDLELLSDCGATGNCDYDFYLYDPRDNRFVYSKFLSGLTSPSFDAAEKRVVTTWNTSPSDGASSTYEFRNGDYVEIERVEMSHSGTDTYKQRKGKLVLVKSEKYDDK